jgi:hypothetical protein
MKTTIANKISKLLQTSAEEIVGTEKTFIGSQPVPQELKKSESK